MLKFPIYDFVAYHYVQSCGHIQEQEMKEREYLYGKWESNQIPEPFHKENLPANVSYIFEKSLQNPQKCCVLIVENGNQLDTVKEIISAAGFSKLSKNMTVATENQVINYNWMRGRRFVHIHCPRKFSSGDLLDEIVSSVGDMVLKNITFY